MARSPLTHLTFDAHPDTYPLPNLQLMPLVLWETVGRQLRPMM